MQFRPQYGCIMWGNFHSHVAHKTRIQGFEILAGHLKKKTSTFFSAFQACFSEALRNFWSDTWGGNISRSWGRAAVVEKKRLKVKKRMRKKQEREWNKGSVEWRWDWSVRDGDVEWTIPKKQAPVCCRLVGPLHLLFWFPLPGLPGYSKVQHVPGNASGSPWNIYPRREETWGKLHGKLKGPNMEEGWGSARMTNIVTKQNFFRRRGPAWAMKLLHRRSLEKSTGRCRTGFDRMSFFVFNLEK